MILGWFRKAPADKFEDEIQRILNYGASRRKTCVSEEQVLQVQRDTNMLIAERVKIHQRELDWRAGIPIEPIAHEATCVMFPAGGFVGQ